MWRSAWFETRFALLTMTTTEFVILRIEQGYERARIDEDHRRGFRRKAICMPRRVSVEGTIA